MSFFKKPSSGGMSQHEKEKIDRALATQKLEIDKLKLGMNPDIDAGNYDSPSQEELSLDGGTF